MARIKVLGSAAAECIPAVFCDCPTCRKAWENGGHDMRLRTAYSLNERVRIDFGPDTMAQEYKYHLHSEKLRHLFFTHSHEDHLAADLLTYRYCGYSKPMPGSTLNVYGNVGVFKVLEEALWKGLGDAFGGDYKKVSINPVLVESYKPIELPEEDMTFYPLPADHMLGDPVEKPNIYIFRVGSSWGMVANDTGYPREDVWAYLQEKKFKLDLVIADCCFALKDSDRGHMGMKANLDMKERLTKIGCLDEHSQYFINHFSHNGLAIHEDMVKAYAPYGIQVAYDGLDIQF